MNPALSIIICTFNRCALAEKALASAARQSVGPHEYEIILVDDGSSDATPAMAARFSDGRQNFRYLRKENAGLSAARNTGWQNARAPLVAFLDDDGTAAADWVAEFLAAARRHPENVACFGGPINLEWEQPRPGWLDDENLSWLGRYEPSPSEIVSRDQGLFRGGNMLIRAAALVRCGGFAVHLGRVGTNLLSQEESAFWTTACSHGYKCAYVPGARIRHWVPRSRLKPGWFRRRVYWEGISMARQDEAAQAYTPFRRRLRALNYLRVSYGRWDNVGRALRPWTWAGHLPWQCLISYHWGVAVGLWTRPS